VWDKLKKRKEWLSELVLLIIAERLFDYALVLGNNVLATRQLSLDSKTILGIFGILAITGAIILGWSLLKRIFYWLRRANEAMKVTQKQDMLPKEEMKQKVEYFNSRQELIEKYPFKSLLSQAKSRIVFLGGSLESVVDIKRHLEKLLKSGIIIELLMQDPEWVKTANIDKGMSSGELSKGIERTLSVIDDILANLGSPEKNNCKIKMYKLHATHSGIVIDPDSSDAKAVIEFYPHDTDAMSKPSIIIDKNKNKEYFERWWNSFKYVLDSKNDNTSPITPE
jgi:hypothetical protein